MFGPTPLYQAWKAIQEEFFAAPPSWQEHLDYDQLSGYVDGTLGEEERESVSAHIEDCQECLTDIQEMTALKAQIDREAQAPIGADKRNSLAMFARMPGYRLAFGLASVVVIFGVTFWIYAHHMQLRIAQLQSANIRFEGENTLLRRNIKEMAAQVPAGASVSLKDGDRNVRLDEQGELRGLDVHLAALQTEIKEALWTGRPSLPPSPVTSLGKVESLRGIDPHEKRFEVISPAGTAVEDTRPAFSWQPIAGTASYTVLMKDLSTGQDMESPPVVKTTWRPVEPLIRGHQYAWMVEARIDGHIVRAPSTDKPYAAFRVLDAQQVQEVDLARKAWGTSHLVMGLTYAKAGLTYEAEKEFNELAAANPESFTARSLLVSVQITIARGRPN